MEIPHPRRILAVSKPENGLLDLVKELTGKPALLTADTVAGTTHTWPVRTAYYTAQIPIWLDEVSEPGVWATEFLAPEAREVLSVLGAFIVCFRKPVTPDELAGVQELLRHVAEVVKEGCGYGWDGACLAVAMPQSRTPYLEKSVEQWEDICQEWGFEFVDFEGKGRNEFSELVGVQRLKEALEANSWDCDEEDGGDSLDMADFEDDDEEAEGSIGFGIEAAEMEAEMAGMKQAIYGGGVDEEDDEANGDEDVENLQAMMLKLQAVRDLGADMPEAERKKFAAKAVNDIMKTL